MLLSPKALAAATIYRDKTRFWSLHPNHFGDGARGAMAGADGEGAGAGDLMAL